MKQKSISALQLLAGLILFIAAGGAGSGMSGMVQQLNVFGPKQWLSLIAGSLVPIAPLKTRFTATRSQEQPDAPLGCADCTGSA